MVDFLKQTWSNKPSEMRWSYIAGVFFLCVKVLKINLEKDLKMCLKQLKAI